MDRPNILHSNITTRSHSFLMQFASIRVQIYDRYSGSLLGWSNVVCISFSCLALGIDVIYLICVISGLWYCIMIIFQIILKLNAMVLIVSTNNTFDTCIHVEMIRHNLINLWKYPDMLNSVTIFTISSINGCTFCRSGNFEWYQLLPLACVQY